MDKSWNFLVETQDSELSAILQLFVDSEFDVCSDVSSIINGMSKDLSLNVVDYDYEQFIDRVCDIFSLNYANNKSLEEKETILLRCFLLIIIDNLSDSEIISFDKCYRFSNDETEGLKKEISSRIAVSDKFKLILPFIVSNLSIPKGINLTSIFYGLPFHLIRPVLESPNIFISDRLTSDKRFKWIPVVSTLIGRRQEYNRPFDLETAKDYLDTIIRFDSTFTSQKYSTLSVMLSLYKSLHDGLKLNDLLIEELTKFLQQKQTAFKVQLFKKAKQAKLIKNLDFKEEYIELICFLMKRLFPCEDDEVRVYRINDHKSAGKGKVAFFYYKLPYSKPEIFPSAKYAMPDDEFEKEAIKLYLSCRDLDLNIHIIAKEDLLKEIEKSISDWTIVIASWDDENNYPKGVTMIKNNPEYEFENIEDYYQVFEKQTGELSVPKDFLTQYIQFLRGEADRDALYNLLYSNRLRNKDYLKELLVASMQIVLEKENFERTTIELGNKFRDLRHHTNIKIGVIRLKLDAIANKIGAGDIETIENKLSEIETLLQIAGNDEEGGQLNLIDELNSQIQGWEDVFSIEKEYNNNRIFCIKYGKTDLSIVLDNIFKNIETHAFTKITPKIAKRVKVTIENLGNESINVFISNNGIPFDGNPEKVFDRGQTYGITGNKGIGLYSVKESMRKYGGDAAFIPNPNKEFCVTVQLTFIGVNKK